MGKSKEDIKDDTWKHCTKVDDNSKKRKLKCNYCGKEFSGGVFRMKNHLGKTSKDVQPCLKVDDSVKDYFYKLLESNKMKKKMLDDEFDGECGEDCDVQIIGDKKKFMMEAFVNKFQPQVKKSLGNTLNTMWKKQDRDEVCGDICRMIYANALPFNLVKDRYFIQMLQSVGAFGKGLKPPSYHEVRVTFLEKEVKRIKVELLDKYKSEWKRTGCTLMSDGWTDGKNRSIINFLVNSPKGTVFLKSIDASAIFHSGENLFNLLDEVIEEIGEESVVQVVTDGASNYVLAGKLLMEKRKTIFWNPCAAHCINLILQDIGGLKAHADTIQKARKITVFIYRHAWVTNLMRLKTKGRELLRPGVTRFATSYLTLKSIHTCKRGLKRLFTSEKWQKSPLSKRGDGLDVEEIVLCDLRFWKAIKYCLKCVLPLVKLLRLVDGDAKPAMGYLYEGLDRAKEKIELNFKNVKSRYQEVWDIIDLRWDYQIFRPLQAAGYYLNPKFHYAPNFSADYEIKKGLIYCIEAMCPSPALREKIDRQLDTFHNAEGMFGMQMAIQMREKKQPALWWDTYGGSTPELQKLAIRVLSLTCSATGCERNWSVFDHVHSKKRSRLEHQRMGNLVFVKYNLQLESRQKRRAELGDSYDPISLSDMESDDEWITEKEDPCLPVDNSWMDVSECFEVEETSRKRKRGPRDLRLKGMVGDKVVEDGEDGESGDGENDSGDESLEDVSSDGDEDA